MTPRDWWLLASGSAWVVGLAIVLAALSWYRWRAHESGRRLRDLWQDPAWRHWHAAGMLLVAIGFGSLPGAATWERAVWAAVALVFAWDLRTVFVRSRDV